jgi:hypothetical protein
VRRRTFALLLGVLFGVVLMGIGFVIVATTLPSCPSILYDQDLYYGGAVVASLSTVGLAYTFRERVGAIGVLIAVAVAFVIVAVALGGFIFGLCGSFA